MIVLYDEHTKLYAFKRLSRMKIDGQEADVIHLNTASSNIVVTGVKPKKIETYHFKMVPEVWEEKFDGSVVRSVSLKDYQDKCASLGFPDGHVDMEFKTPEDRIEWARFSVGLILKNKKEEWWEVADFEIVNRPVSEHACISPYATMDDIDSCAKALFQYSPPVVDMIREASDKLGCSVTWSNTGPKYAKIKDKYVWHGDNGNFRGFTGSYDDCVSRMHKDRERIFDDIKLCMLKSDESAMPVSMVKDYYLTMTNILSQVRALEVKSKHDMNKSVLLNILVKKLKNDPKDFE